MEQHHRRLNVASGSFAAVRSTKVLREDCQPGRSGRFFIPVAASIPFSTIDAEHHALADCLNTIWSAGEANRFAGQALVPLFDNFCGLVETHFANEERAMMLTEFPGHARHRIRHQTFLGDVAAICADIRKGHFASESRVKDLFINVIDDALRDDLVFKTYLEGRGFI